MEEANLPQRVGGSRVTVILKEDNGFGKDNEIPATPAPDNSSPSSLMEQLAQRSSDSLTPEQ